MALCDGFPILPRFRFLYELSTTAPFVDERFDFVQLDVVIKLFAGIGQVDSAVFEVMVKRSLQIRRVVGEDHGVNIKREWDRGTAELVHPLQRFHSTGHSNFEDTLPERADIRYDVHESRLCDFGARYRPLLLFAGLIEFGLERSDLIGELLKLLAG